MGVVKEQMMDDQFQRMEDEVAEYLGLTSAEYGSTEHEYDERSGQDVVRFTSISDDIKAKLTDYNYDEDYVPIDWNQIESAKETNE